MHPSQSTQRENRQSNFRVRHSSQGTSLLITTAVLTQTLFAWQSQIKKAQLILPYFTKNSKNKNKPTPKSSVRQFYSLSLQLQHGSCNTQRQSTAPSMCSPSTPSISLASNRDVGQQGLALLIYVFFIYRRHRPTFNHLFAGRHLRQPLCLSAPCSYGGATAGFSPLGQTHSASSCTAKCTQAGDQLLVPSAIASGP